MSQSANAQTENAVQHLTRRRQPAIRPGATIAEVLNELVWVYGAKDISMRLSTGDRVRVEGVKQGS